MGLFITKEGEREFENNENIINADLLTQILKLKMSFLPHNAQKHYLYANKNKAKTIVNENSTRNINLFFGGGYNQ